MEQNCHPLILKNFYCRLVVDETEEGGEFCLTNWRSTEGLGGEEKMIRIGQKKEIKDCFCYNMSWPIKGKLEAIGWASMWDYLKRVIFKCVSFNERVGDFE